MIKYTHMLSGLLNAVVFFIIIFLCLNQTNLYGKEAVLKKLEFNAKTGTLTMVVSQKIPSKVILVDNKELLIALKNIHPEKGVKGSTFKKGSLVKNIALEKLPGDVLAIVVSGFRPFKEVNASWDTSGFSFIVNFKGGIDSKIRDNKSQEFKKVTPDSSAVLPQYSKDGFDSQEKFSKNSLSPSSVKKQSGTNGHKSIKKRILGPQKDHAGFAGDISDLLKVVDIRTCLSDKLDKSHMFLTKGLWKNSLELLTKYLGNDLADCREQAEFLYAYAVLKQSDKDQPQDLLMAKNLFQDILVTWPESRLIPFAYASLGIIQDSLSNPAAAEGFFTMILDEYKDYAGIPEVLFFMSKIYDAKGYNEKALVNYNIIFEKYPYSTYAVDAGIGVGKALFKKLHYIESRDILSSIVESNPEKIYDSPDLLLSIGNAEFALGNSTLAREVLTQVCNIFPDVEEKDMILTRIGDTYAIEKNLNRAKRIYKFVMEKYPGGEGFLNSAMGLALILDKREEIEEIYNMVKKDFFDHRLARVAMMRLAQLYNKDGEYLKCIQEVEKLLASNPTGIRYDAVKLMQEAYESLFTEQLAAGEFPEILKRYEESQVLFDRLESRAIYLDTGLAYLKAHLYEQAFNQLIKAYKLYKKSSRPPDLLFGIAVAMDETNRKDDALKNFRAFAERKAPHPDKVKAYLRMGNILLEKGKIESSSRNFSKAEKLSKDHIEKGTILMQHAEVYKKQENWPKVSELITMTVNEFASAPGENYELLTKAHRELGQSYVNQKAYGSAVDAFALAVKFSSDGGKNASNLEFLLGDAYQKGNNLDKAKETFEKVAGTDDSIWARLAKERLSTIDLAEKVSNS